MNKSIVQPSVWYYGLAILIIIIGFLAFAGFIFTSISDIGNELAQVVVPGSKDLDLKEAGEYTIFYENRTYVNGEFYNTGDQISGLRIFVLETAAGSYLDTYPSVASSYSMAGRDGRSIMAFKAKRAGIYRINASYSNGSGPKVVLAIGKGVMEDFFLRVLMSVAALFGSIAVAAIIVFVTYTRRKKALDLQKEEERVMRGD